jgi:hypothetical protein
MQQPANFHRVKYLALLALVFLTGCQTTYTRLSVSDYTGEHIATWVAEGPVREHELGYRIRAVERISGGNSPVTSRYPNGFSAVVVGPNIVRERIPKPLWIVELDADVTPIELTPK